MRACRLLSSLFVVSLLLAVQAITAGMEMPKVEVPPDIRRSYRALPKSPASPRWARQAGRRMVKQVKNLPRSMPESHKRQPMPEPDTPEGDYDQRQSFYFRHFFGAAVWPGLRELMKVRPRASQVARATADLLAPHCFPVSECDAYLQPAAGSQSLGTMTDMEPGVYTYAGPQSGILIAQAATGGGFQYLDVYTMFALDLTAWNTGRVYAAVEYEPEMVIYGGGFGPESDPLNTQYYARAELVGYAEKDGESAAQVQPMMHLPNPAADDPDWYDFYEYWDVPIPWLFSWPIAEPFHVQVGDEFRLLVGFRLQTSNPGSQGGANLGMRSWIPEVCVRIAPGE
jgi:hypothetical protein